MQPNGNVIVDTICRTAKLGTTITGATENGDVTVIEAEPVEPINECPTCGQPGVFRDHVIRSLVDLPIEVSQVLFRLMKPVFETTYGAQRTPMPKLPQHRLPHQTHDSGIHTLNPHACNLRTSKIEK
ncbi:hypothetical protein [Corynebacterium parakroppenstedtii]